VQIKIILSKEIKINENFFNIILWFSYTFLFSNLTTFVVVYVQKINQTPYIIKVTQLCHFG